MARPPTHPLNYEQQQRSRDRQVRRLARKVRMLQTEARANQNRLYRHEDDLTPDDDLAD